MSPISGLFRTGLSCLLKSSTARRGDHEGQAIYGRANHLRAASGGERYAGDRRLSAAGRQRGESFYLWKKKYGKLGMTEIRELRQLRDENARLKRLVAELTLDKHILGEVVRKKL